MFWLSFALAYDADALLTRVDAVEALRSDRLSERAPTLDRDVYRAAAAGKIVTGVEKVEGHAAKLGYGVGVVDVPIDALWAALNDETRHGDLVPLSRIELVSGRACEDGRKVLMVLPLPLLTDRYWVNVNRYNAGLAEASGGKVRELVWSSVADPASEPLSAEGKAAVKGLVPIGFNRGAWFLVALDDGHTLAEYHSWVDPGGSVPAGPAGLFATSGIEDTFEAMAGYARAGRLPCKEAP
ncbi:MAG: hypothetical protein H6737_22800 [Alphaproteobacteria bacterium]|nr:hypothetical protein [Alphaproteobacteria bacterium]